MAVYEKFEISKCQAKIDILCQSVTQNVFLCGSVVEHCVS